MTRQSILIGLAWVCLLCAATKAGAAEFTYRGVKFGLTRDEVSKLVPLVGDTNQAAGGAGLGAAKGLSFEFDDKGQLYTLQISYWMPKPLHVMRPALRRALQKKYGVNAPSEKVWDLGDVLMSFEEYYIGNQSYLRTTITHKRLYDEYLDRLADQLAPSLRN